MRAHCRMTVFVARALKGATAPHASDHQRDLAPPNSKTSLARAFWFAHSSRAKSPSFSFSHVTARRNRTKNSSLVSVSSQPTNQPANQPTNHPNQQPTHQHTNQQPTRNQAGSRASNPQTNPQNKQPANQLANQPTNQPPDQPANQATSHKQPNDPPSNQPVDQVKMMKSRSSRKET